MEAGITMQRATEAPAARVGERPVVAIFGGATIILGALLMVAGAISLSISGTSLDEALVDGTVGAYLVDAADNMRILTANLSFWMVGATLLGIGGLTLTRLSARDSATATAAQGMYLIGAALALAAFSIWMGIVRDLAPAHAAGTDLAAVGTALGQAAMVADWAATSMLIGFGPLLVAIAGRNTWVPRWLLAFGIVAAITGVVSIFGIFIGERSTLGFIVVPVGLVWTLSAGIVAIRHRTRS